MPAWLAQLANVARVEALAGGPAGREWADLAAELGRAIAGEFPPAGAGLDLAVVEQAYAAALALKAKPGPALQMAAWVGALVRDRDAVGSQPLGDQQQPPPAAGDRRRAEPEPAAGPPFPSKPDRPAPAATRDDARATAAPGLADDEGR